MTTISTMVGLGSTRQLTNSTGVLTASYTYDSFGNSVGSVSSVANSYGFTGQQQFAEADNLVFLRARYYKTSLGRFISRDPIKYGDGMNMYSYVHNNAVNARDPRGLDSPGCDLPGGSWGNHCWRRCCAIHDECYKLNGCTEDSWLNPGKFNPNCKKCNDAVSLCFITHLVCCWNDTDHDYFGPCSNGIGYGYGRTKNPDGTVNCNPGMGSGGVSGPHVF